MVARETESANKANALIFWAGEAVSDDDSSFDRAVDPTSIEDLRQTRQPGGRFGKPDWSHQKLDTDTVWNGTRWVCFIQFFSFQFPVGRGGPAWAHVMPILSRLVSFTSSVSIYSQNYLSFFCLLFFFFLRIYLNYHLSE